MWQKIFESGRVHGVIEVAAWPNMWVLRGETVVPRISHTLYGYDAAANRLLWALDGLVNGPITWHHCPSLVRAGDVAVAATYVGKRRDQTWLLGLKPRTGDLLWRRPVAWHRGKTSGGSLMETAYAGLVGTAEHVIVLENSSADRCVPLIRWLDPATGAAVYECPGPDIRRAAVAAGGYLYYPDVEMDDEPGLYRVPAAPGGHMEKVADVCVKSLLAAGERLYATYSDEKDNWTACCWEASSMIELARREIDFEGGQYDWPQVDAVLPGDPYHVILHRNQTHRALNLRSGQVLWEQTVEHGPLTFLHVPAGLLGYTWVQDAMWVDPATGAGSDAGLGHAEQFFAIGDRLLAGVKFWKAGCRIYAPAAEAPPQSPGSDDAALPSRKLRELLPDLLTDPRDELEALFAKAASGRGSLNPFFKAFRPLIGAGQIHKKVKDFLTALKAGELDAGPLTLTPFADLHGGCFYYSDLFGFGPQDRFFPAILFASETYGVEFYLMVETGAVISLHHDATFSEVASDVWKDCGEHVLAFERQFPQHGALLDIAQLTRFQQAFKDCDHVEKLGDLDPRDFFTRTTQAFGWTLRQFRDNMDDVRLEFLYHYSRDHEDVLAAMLAE